MRDPLDNWLATPSQVTTKTSNPASLSSMVRGGLVSDLDYKSAQAHLGAFNQALQSIKNTPQPTPYQTKGMASFSAIGVLRQGAVKGQNGKYVANDFSVVIKLTASVGSSGIIFQAGTVSGLNQPIRSSKTFADQTSVLRYVAGIAKRLGNNKPGSLFQPVMVDPQNSGLFVQDPIDYKALCKVIFNNTAQLVVETDVYQKNGSPQIQDLPYGKGNPVTPEQENDIFARAQALVLGRGVDIKPPEPPKEPEMDIKKFLDKYKRPDEQ